MWCYVNFRSVITVIRLNNRQTGATMTVKKFYKTEAEFARFYAGLKLMHCPHCRHCGCLILHGYLKGFADAEGSCQIKRGRRVFCSNRNKKDGCGRTFSLLMTTFIRRFRLPATALWRFLDNIRVGKNKIRAFADAGSALGQTSCYRLYQLFKQSQVRIRTRLSQIKPPPLADTHYPVIQTIEHLAAVFDGHDCPVAQFQYCFQSSFL